MATESRQLSLKLRTARTLKWNTIDKVSSQVLYAVTGIVLANVLPREDFGLVGAILIFQAFAILFVDSGFGSALLQKKNPTDTDYSTVFWFNLLMSCCVYAVLFFSAPLIARMFHDDQRLIPLSRVMFVGFIICALGIVQTNRLMKRMDVRQVALGNVVGLLVSGTVGIWLALTGAGAWALVWQSIVLYTVKTAWLWVAERWLPRPVFSRQSLKDVWRVGAGVFTSSFFNTLFLHIYSFVIGAFYTLAALGDYTQADKWSKMGSASLSQILTSSFIPVLAQYQDDKERFYALMTKINGFTAFSVFPAMLALAVMATPIFHILFGTKWDSAIILFQILLVRGIFVVLTAVANNYVLSLGKARALVVVEVVKDLLTVSAIFATVFLHSVPALVWGQLVASVLTYFFVLWLVYRITGMKPGVFLAPQWRYLMLAFAAAAAMWMLSALPLRPAPMLVLEAASGLAIYLGILKLFRDPYLGQGAAYVLGRFKRKTSLPQ